MEALFLKVVNMSIAAGWLVIAVMLLRLLLKKAPKSAAVLMWALVGIRLVCPFALESPLSLIPSTQTIPENFTTADTPAVQSGISAVNSAVNPAISSALAPAAEESANPAQVIVFAACVIWVAGMAVMLLYVIISFLATQRKVRESIPYKENIRLCDQIGTPFIFGVFRPVIYLPSGIDRQDSIYVTAHEKAHLRRHDHWWKPLGFFLLAIHWFNPLVWAAYFLFCRNIEFACDEQVIKEMGPGVKKPYAHALINCSAPRSSLAACPLAFGEAGVKARIRSVLNYRKPGFWIVTAAAVVCVILAVCFLTSPPDKSPTGDSASDQELSAYLETVILEHYRTDYSANYYCCTDFDILGTDESDDRITVYMWVMYGEYSYDSTDGLQEQSGAYIPTVVTVRKGSENTGSAAGDDGNFELEEYWEPRDGSYYEGDIRNKFPLRLQGRALDLTAGVERQAAACEQKALEYFESRESGAGDSGTDTGDSGTSGSGTDSSVPGNSGSGNSGTAQTEETITYRYTPEYDAAGVVLSPSDGTFTFTYSLLSSYLPRGRMEEEGDKLLLYTDDGENHYTFRRQGENLVFLAGESSPLPEYRYSGDSSETLPCVPDGAVFEQEEPGE